MNLILVSPEEMDDQGVVTLSDRRATHIRNVLNAREGQTLRIGQLNGPRGTGDVLSVRDEGVTLRCVFTDEIPARPPVDLLLAMPRPKVMKRLWAPLAALGVGRILITNAQKVERYYFDSHILDPVFYTERLQEGLEQAMDTRLPIVSVHRQFKVLIEDELEALAPDTYRLIADPSVARRVRDALNDKKPPRALLAVGPEGGWSEYERALLTEHGFLPVGIGPRILRTDTACIALLAMVHDALS